MKHKRILITGGTGFIGQELARYYGKENHVILLSRQSVTGQNNNYNKHLVKARTAIRRANQSDQGAKEARPSSS